MIKITRKDVIYQMSAENPPAAKVDSGETVVFETYDCYQGQLLPEGNTFKNVDRRFGNPATGPVFVNGAMPGDMLKITVEKLELGPVGILDIGPNSGALKEYFDEVSINRIHVKDGVLKYDERLQIKAEPMIGVIGNAPAEESVSTMTPKDHGGNMDCTKICEGAKLYLPVFVEGALLALGDFHAIMGEGEVGNCGVEIEGEATLKLDVVHDMKFTFPLIENEEQWITVAYGETLDEAAAKASKQMFQFLKEQFGLNNVDAGMLIDMLGNLIVCQIVNPMKTVRMEIPKWAIAKLSGN
ncbi:MAG: acetamidase/formamidase family protein [Lachnospiraceae bacterium]|nr:acetamidase/formamidase family protein [Lachnospiraceae bacterium]